MMNHASNSLTIEENISEGRDSHWLLPVLFFLFIYVISYIDRQILSLVVQPVKDSLGLSDFQIGLLQGPAFSLVLATAAVVASPLIDRGNRTRLISLCMIVWCGMTVACGLAQDFNVLLVARTGLAISEGILPMAVMSIICDIAPKSSVPRASALFMAAPYLGSGFALLMGGPILAQMEPFDGMPFAVIGVFEPWRGLFFMLGAPGILIGVLMFVFLREPARTGGKEAADPSVSVFPFFRRNIGFLTPLLIGNAMIVLLSYTIYAWSPTFMIRNHAMSAATAGLTVGTIFVISGISGCIFGGWIMSRSKDGKVLSHVVRTIAIMFLCLAPFMIAFPLVANASLALVLLAVAFFLMAAGLSSVMTPIALFAPPAVRGRTLSAAGLCYAGLGGLGPMVVGAFNDFVFGTPDAIGLSLAICIAGACAIGLGLLPQAIRLATKIDNESERVAS